MSNLYILVATGINVFNKAKKSQLKIKERTHLPLRLSWLSDTFEDGGCWELSGWVPVSVGEPVTVGWVWSVFSIHMLIHKIHIHDCELQTLSLHFIKNQSM